MIQAHYICNGCSKYTNYKGRMEAQLNVLEVDMTNYLLFNSGFRLKEPRLDLHFCDECFVKVQDGASRVAALGNVEVMRKKLEAMEERLGQQQNDFDDYRARVAILLRKSEVSPKETKKDG